MISLLPWRLIAAVVAVLALLGGTWWHGHSAGAAGVQAKWDKRAQEDREVAEALRESNRLRGQAAAADYEVKRAAFARRVATPSPESVYALHATICPRGGPLNAPLELGDVPIPGVWLERLRDSGADYTGH